MAVYPFVPDRLGAGNSATVRFSGQNRIALLGAGSGTDIRFSGDGAITVDAVSLPEQDAGPVYVSGGSVRTSFTESGGRRPFVFPAAGTVRCTVNGEAYPYTCPHADGTATLWLPEPGADSAWLSDTADGILSVRLGVTTQEDSLRRPASGLHEAAAGETWLFGTDTPADAVLHIAAADVTVILQDADIRSEQIRAVKINFFSKKNRIFLSLKIVKYQ